MNFRNTYLLLLKLIWISDQRSHFSNTSTLNSSLFFFPYIYFKNLLYEIFFRFAYIGQCPHWHIDVSACGCYQITSSPTGYIHIKILLCKLPTDRKTTKIEKKWICNFVLFVLLPLGFHLLEVKKALKLPEYNTVGILSTIIIWDRGLCTKVNINRYRIPVHRFLVILILFWTYENQ